MELTDPRAQGFDPDVFKDAIHFAMNLAAPQATDERVTFRWTTSHTYPQQDASHKPFSWVETPTTTTSHADVQVPVAVEFTPTRSGEGGTAVGGFENARLVLTLLDDDYALVRGADRVVINENEWDVRFVEPPVALFSVTVYRIYCEPRDLSAT